MRSWSVTVAGAETSRSIAVINGPQRSRAIVNRAGPALDLSANERAIDLMTHTEWVHTDQYGG